MKKLFHIYEVLWNKKTYLYHPSEWVEWKIEKELQQNYSKQQIWKGSFSTAFFQFIKSSNFPKNSLQTYQQRIIIIVPKQWLWKNVFCFKIRHYLHFQGGGRIWWCLIGSTLIKQFSSGNSEFSQGLLVPQNRSIGK